MMKQIVLITLIIGNLTLANAQVQRFSLRQCIDYAWMNNLDIRQSILNNESARLDAKQSKTSLLPTLSATAGQNYQFGRTVDRFSNIIINQSIRSNNYGINAGMTLFNGFQNINNIKQKTYLQKSNEATIEYTKNQIALSISSAFLQNIQAIESINNAQLQIISTQTRIERAEKQVEAGVSDLSNLLTLRAQLANEQLALINSENGKNAALLTLRNLMQLPISVEFEVEVPSVEGITMEKTPIVLEIYETALKTLPQIKSAEQQSYAAKAQSNIAKGALSPTVSMYGSVSTVYSESAKNITGVNPTGTQTIGYTQNTNEIVLQPTYTYNTEVIDFNQQLKDNIGQGVGFNFSWNLFNGFQVQNQIQKAKINMQVSDMNLQKQKNTLLNDINAAVNNYNAAKSKHDATKNSMQAQKTSLDYIQKRFDAGAATTFDFINAKNSYLQAQSNEIQAKYELVFRALIIEYYKGNTITL